MDTSSIRLSVAKDLSIRPAEIEAQLKRILESSGFRNAARIRRFLQFAVEHTLAGQGDQLKEYTVGRDVFDRGADYDPRTDSIVRVEAQRLRKKLREYYEGAGAADPVEIGFPPGSYVAAFTRIVQAPPMLVRSAGGRPPLASPLDVRTVAVLPFSNLSPESKQQYFCDGITEDIITALTSVPDLQVIGRTSTFALKQGAHDLREIGARLGAGTIVEGTVRKAGAVLRISVTIIDADTRQAKWSQVFDRKVRDLFAIEDEIARSIADTLRITLGPGGPKDSTHPPGSAGAHVLYLKGRQAWNRMTRDGLFSAIDYFSGAISRHPDYAPLYAGLADGYAWLATWGLVRPKEALAKSRSAAREALRLDPASASAHSSLGAAMCFLEWDWQQGSALLKKSILLQPSCSVSQQRYGIGLMVVGRFDEAVTHLRHAVHLDPLSIRTNRTLGAAYYLKGNAAEAQRWLEAAIALEPESAESHYLFARLHLQLGNNKEALKEALQCDTIPPNPLPLSVLGVSLARNGDKSGALGILKRLAGISSAGYVDPLTSAFVHLALGNRAKALDLLEESLEQRSPFAAFGNVDPLLDDLRSEPRFRNLMSSMKIPPP